MEDCIWQTSILTPKRGNEFRRIGLLEVMWKTVMGVQFHDSLHGFHTSIGMRIDSLEVNMLQQLMDMREEVIYEIF